MQEGELVVKLLSTRDLNGNYIVMLTKNGLIKRTPGDSFTKIRKTGIRGITFKEDCPDIRNSRVIDVIDELKDYGVEVEIYDPHADSNEVKHEYNIDLIDTPGNDYNAVVLAVKHKVFDNLDWRSIKNESTVVFDVKAGLEKGIVSERL